MSSGQGAEVKDAAREKAREAALKRLEAEAKDKDKEKEKKDAKLPEFGSEKDFQLW